MAVPNSVFWIDEMVKVFDRKRPQGDDINLREYKEFINEMYAYLVGLRSSVKMHQDKLDRREDCYVCGNKRKLDFNENVQQGLNTILDAFKDEQSRV